MSDHDCNCHLCRPVRALERSREFDRLIERAGGEEKAVEAITEKVFVAFASNNVDNRRSEARAALAALRAHLGRNRWVS